MTFFFDLPWRYWELPALLVLAWTGLWWASRRARLWFAGLTPPAALAVLLLGVFELLTMTPQPSCSDGSCPEDPGTAIIAVGLLSLIVASALTIVTFVVETTLMVRRSERAEREATAESPNFTTP
ncbi:hypothetical protein [Actinoplanes sp. L3-i22]|uniref:hypothetical protein n=1 Tax=Actinoplanes sp. L3-i22 TaxID=2836373 RepID=UPI001C762BF9|nr:hypothetical protein [Actinoplanes sp. L3-i22]BCY05398.1 hypothetical protein L3i22_004860 [Actinoplanes sp. L3-i22]